MNDGATSHVRQTLIPERPAPNARTDLIVETTLSSHTSANERRAARLRFLVPIAAFVALLATFGWALNRDPGTIPSALIGQQVPQFVLPAVKGRTLALSSTDLMGDVSLVNVFASWCVACREEHPVFMQIKAGNLVPIHGLNYKDPPNDAAKWLDAVGDPYTRTGADFNGRVAIDWGVYGVPETFVITKDGHIAHKHIGAVTPRTSKRRFSR
jgi:cytochrome c biogenesis protein CcmG/thiol:disulfide interchange protein DsbE